uniref:ADAM metallopeptidase domain 30 n=1 Tax=Monodelphis domestica TaxID=13616 RepID=F7FQP8_MONDO
MGAASLLLLGLGTLVLGKSCWSQDFDFNPDWGFTSYEVIIPRQLEPRGGYPNRLGRVSYLMRIQGKRNIVHLRPKKLLLPRHLRVFTFADDGTRVEDQPYIPRPCNFKGSVEGSPESEAILSTCLGGLRGMLRIEDSVYQIEPVQYSYNFEHVIYRLQDHLMNNFTCGLTKEEIDRQLSLLRYLPADRSDSWRTSYVHQKYLELIIVLDKLRFTFLKSNLTRAISDSIIMGGVMDSYFQSLNARIQLIAIEVWTDKSKVNTNVKKLSQVLGEFSKYNDKILYLNVKSDWAHLYVHKYYPDALGWAFVGGVCKRKYGVSTSTLPNKNLIAPAIWSTHEVGHGVGMQHDGKNCFCFSKTECLMGSGGSTGFSNCSFVNYFDFINWDTASSCLNNIPGLVYTMQRCGNKIIEKGEECDCGTIEECKKDMCCQIDCKLRPGAQCNTGLCCTNCHFSPSGHKCREEQNECDLAEFCNGTSNFCPTDLYKQDGTPCSRGARCYQKGCHDRFLQCKEIFGSGALNAPYLCYKELNKLTDRFANCGLKGQSYKQCKSRDIMCGRLQCVNVKNVPDMPDHTTVIFTHVKEFNIRCWGIDYHSSMISMALPDEGAVKDGTSCGHDLICINRSCLNVSVLKYDCLPEKCNKRGVCNNKKNCHCNYGWAPPFCENPGFGGSINSGPRGKMKDVPKSVKVVPIIFIRLLLLGISLVMVILKGLSRRFFKPKKIVRLTKDQEVEEEIKVGNEKVKRREIGERPRGSSWVCL